MTHPIEIIGGGLAGLALGTALQRAGVPVTLYEAGDYPRHRVCGEFIAGLSVSTIVRLGLEAALAGALRHEEVAWAIGDAPPQIQRLPAPALGLSRFALDARLARMFAASGGTLHPQSRVTHTASPPGRVWATGRRRAAVPCWIGLKVHVRGLVLTRDLEMHLGAQAYVGLAQVEDGAVNVCGLFRRRSVAGRGTGLLLGYLRATGLTPLADRLAQAEPDPNSFCAVAALDFDRRFGGTAGRICLGDAGAMIPPFTGNGMAMALQSAETALPALLAYARGECDWAATCQSIQDALRRRFRLRLASASALHAFFLKPRPQRWMAALGRARLIPFGPLYAAVH